MVFDFYNFESYFVKFANLCFSLSNTVKRKRTVFNEPKTYYTEIHKRPKLDEDLSGRIRVGPTFSADPSRFRVIQNEVALINRKQLYKRLDDFMTKNPTFPVLYIHGPPGFGKSHLLLRKVNDLCLDPECRVFYIASTTQQRHGLDFAC